MKHLLFFLAVLPVFFACHEDHENAVAVWINGKAEKGPFLPGSEIKLEELNDSLQNTGTRFTGIITSLTGNFQLETIDLHSSYARFSVKGRFLNELTGNLSDAPFTLEGIADLYNRSEYHINVLTHFIAPRIEFLLHVRHLSYRQANRQAQQELWSCLDMESFTDQDVSTFSLDSGTKESGMLIVLSSALLLGTDTAGPDEWIEELRNDFMESGTLATERKHRFMENMRRLDLQAIAANLTSWYQSFDETIHIPDLSPYIPEKDF